MVVPTLAQEALSRSRNEFKFSLIRFALLFRVMSIARRFDSFYWFVSINNREGENLCAQRKWVVKRISEKSEYDESGRMDSRQMFAALGSALGCF